MDTHVMGTQPPAPRSLSAFAGTWSLQRKIVDHRRGETGSFTGTVSITGDDREVIYREEGSLILAARPPVRGTRTYRWHKVGHAIEVFFNDHRPFHSFALGRHRVAAEHLCRADLYRVTYDFCDWPAWSTVWDVQGPAKKYRLVSHYARTCTPMNSEPKLSANDLKTGDGNHGHDDR